MLPVGSPEPNGRELYVVVSPIAAVPVFALRPVPAVALGPELVCWPDRKVVGSEWVVEPRIPEDCAVPLSPGRPAEAADEAVPMCPDPPASGPVVARA